MNIHEQRRHAFAWLVQHEDGGNKAKAGRRIGKDSSYVGRLLSVPGATGHRNIEAELMRAIQEGYGKEAGWLDTFDPHVDPTSTRRDSTPLPLISRERREGDDETAIQIAIESIAEVISRLVPGGAQALLDEIAIRAAAERENHGFSPNHKLLGGLSDIAEQARDDAAAVAQARRRGGSAHGTKRDTSDH